MPHRVVAGTGQGLSVGREGCLQIATDSSACCWDDYNSLASE